MNRFLILASLLIAALSCSKESAEPTIEPTLPSSGSVVSLTASLTDAESRVEVDPTGDEGWTFVWEVDDAISGWSTGCSAPSSFVTDVDNFDEKLSTFTGTVADDADYHRFVSPYEAATITSEGYYPIDVSSQVGELAKTYLINDALVPTTDIISGTTSALYMKHLGGFMVVDIFLEGYNSSTTYTLTDVSYSGMTVAADIDMTQGVDSDVLYYNMVEGSIEATDLGIEFVEVDYNGVKYLQAIARINILPLEFKAGKSIDINIVVSNGSTSKTLSTSITNSGTTSLMLERATYNYTYLTLDSDEGDAISITNCTINDWGEQVDGGDLALDVIPDISYNTETSTYEIATANGLRAFADLVNGSACSVSYLICDGDDSRFNFGTTNSSIDGKLLRDIDLWGIDAEGNGVVENEFTPIGESSSQNYNGTFDGNGYEISGLYINQPDLSYQALFGYISRATIKNLGVSGSVTGCGYVGGVVGYASSSTVSYCHNTGSIVGSDNYVGGVVGRAYSTTISDCYNAGSVEGSDYHVGGVVGYASSSTVSDCYNASSVKGLKRYVGGVVGYAASSTTVSYCHNTGSIVGSSYYVGGVVGYAYTSTTVSNCYNAGSVEGLDYYVGGVVGRAYSTTVSSCYNAGSVEGSDYYVGGVVGYTISSTTVSDCYNTGSVAASSRVGGIVGEAESGSSVKNCYNIGSISGSYSGGVLGRIDDSTTVSTVEYSYYDSSVVTGVKGAINGSDDGTNYCGLSTEMMKSDATTEGSLLYYLTNENCGNSSEWKSDTDNINNGYPILTWQTSK